MKYICDEDRQYILNKYHDADKPFNSFARFRRHDEIFDPSTGMEPVELVNFVQQKDNEIADLPHPIRKARAMGLLLSNMRIACDKRDRFPALNLTDRPLGRAVIYKWEHEVFGETIPETSKKLSQLEGDGIVTIWPDYDHSVPVWGRVLSLGFPGLLRESRKAHETLAAKHPLSDEEEAFFGGIDIVYEAILAFLGRLAELAYRQGSDRMAKALENLKTHAPATLYEALLTIYLYFVISEHVDSLQVRSLSNLDVMLYPFYQKDLENGCSDEEERTDLAYFLMQYTSIGDYWNIPFYLAGTDKDGSSLVNPFSYIILDVYDRMGIYNPKIQIKVSPDTPEDFVKKALDMIRRGHSCIVFVSDPTIQKALIRAGATPEQARTCRIHGCYEYSVEGSIDTLMNYMNLVKPLEYTMREGHDGVTSKLSGLPCPAEYPDFDAFYTEYKRQLAAVIDTTIETVNIVEDYLDVINPQPMLSATIPECLASARDAFGGGAAKNGTTLFCGFLADLSDSLTAVKRLVFEQKRYTLQELRTILDNDFKGNEKLRMALLKSPEKYGNNKELPDFFAKDIAAFLASYICGKPNAKRRGGTWFCGFHVARMSYDQAPLTATTPNGRLRGEELSKNISASMGQNREGITAAILSATKIDASAFPSDAALDAGLLPSAVQGEDGLEAMYGLLMTFVKRGGHAIHFNVFDAETLRDAQAHPDNYRDLQIRVCGWNVLFNDINKEEQDGFIRQAEALI